jgi:uncharacterized protein
MTKSFIAPTTYFLQEGRENLEECLKVAFQAAVQHEIKKIVIFTAYGDGVKMALDLFLQREEYADIKLVAVTFPAGKTFTNQNKEPFEIKIPGDLLQLFASKDVPLVRAHLPFDAVDPSAAWGAVVGRGFNLLGETLNMFCGSMSLCVQAITLACDAGFIEQGEHVISLTSDTAILAMAAVTRKTLSELVIREVLCKPVVLTIGRKEQKSLAVPKIRKLKAAKPPRLGK